MSEPYPPQFPPQEPQRVPAQPPVDPTSDFVPDGGTTPYDPRLTIDPGRFVAGALATALVAALVGLVGAVIIEGVFNQHLVPPPDLFSTGSHGADFAIDGAIFALLAAGVLALLVVSTPRPRRFFGWIMALATVIITVLPFAWTSHTDRAVLSAVVNLVIGVATWSLLAGVATRTIVPASGPATATAPRQVPPSGSVPPRP